MSTTEPFGLGQLEDALRRLNIPDVSAPDLGVLPFAHGGAGLDYAGIAAAVMARELRPPVGIPATPSSFYFLDSMGAPAPPALSPPTAAALPTVAEFGAANAVPAFASGPRGLDPLFAKRDFPILRERVNGREIVWLDNAATTQKPASVIARLQYFYEHENSNVHRGAHELAARATDAYEGAREKVRGFLNARSVNEIVFVRGATEAINLVAQSWGRQHVGADDEIIVSHLEHHANIVPWQQLAWEKGAKLRVIPVDDSGQILFDEYLKLLTPRTKIVSVSQVSNALGTVTPVKAIVEQAKRNGVRALVDGAQAVSHMRVDVREIDCDWYVFSGHKIFGPTGIGVLYGREDLLNASPPWQGGGNMIKDVTFERTLYQDSPTRYEAGTGNIADAVGLGAAIDYVAAIGMDAIDAYEHQLLGYATHRLRELPGLRMIGTAVEKAGVLSFTFDGFRTEDLGALLNKEGIAVRSGHHCAQPILRRFGVEATVRASLALYNTCADIDALVIALQRLRAGAPPRL
jgi:cysteine desulfurase / selenocysteine lyase